MKKLRYSAALLVGLGVVLIGQQAEAKQGRGSDDVAAQVELDDETTMTPQASPSPTTKPNERGNGKVKVAETKVKSTDKKLAACQKREAGIKAKMARIAEHGERQTAVFGSIASRTEAYYASKGLAVAAYPVLVADVAAKKAAAEATMVDIKANSAAFSCEASDPKAAVTAFKTSLEAERSAMKAYKTAVKNLIVGVKSAKATASSPSPSVSPSPSPSASPSAGATE